MCVPTDFGLFFAQTGAPNVFTYFSQSNAAGKVIVLALLLFSLIAWTIMIGKYLDLKRMHTLNTLVERRLRQAHKTTALHLPETYQGPYAYLTTEAIKANTTSKMGPIENALQRAVARQTILYESKMVLLGSIVSGAPFLGLLGTVWGVMDAFGGIALQNTASLQALAPGICGALLTTVAGLLVAIPSVFGYNFLLSQSKILITQLENFASSLADQLALEKTSDDSTDF